MTVWLLLATATVPATLEPAVETVIALGPTVDGSIRALIVAWTWVLTGAPELPLGGLIWTTVGPLVTAPLPV